MVIWYGRVATDFKSGMSVRFENILKVDDVMLRFGIDTDWKGVSKNYRWTGFSLRWSDWWWAPEAKFLKTRLTLLMESIGHV